MNDRKPILFGGVLLVAVMGVGAMWFLSSGPSSSASVASAAAQGGFPAGPDAAAQPIPLDHAELIPMTVYLTPTCGCCSEWVAHIEQHGFAVELEYMDNLYDVKQAHAISPRLQSCHTAVVNGYAMEGHVPGDVVRQFLAEAPEARGLAVPGMPVGSPGMEFGDITEPYDVLSFTSDGRTLVYSRQGRD